MYRATPLQVSRALDLLQERLAESAQGHTIAALIDALVNVYMPCCASIGWQVRRCFWEGRHAGSGAWAAQCLRHCLLLLCALLGDKAKVSEYARSIGVALLGWTAWHDAMPAAAYVEEGCEAQLSQLSSALKRNPHATGIADVSDMYVLLPAPDDQPHAARHHPVSAALQRALHTNLDHYVNVGPRTVSYVPWRSGKTCKCAPRWPENVHIPRTPWTVAEADIQASLLYTLSRVHTGKNADASVVELCNDFLPRSSRAHKEDFARAVACVQTLTGATSVPPVTRTLVRQLTVRDRTDPPPKRRRRAPTSAPHPRTSPTAVPADDGRAAYSGPRFVGIPLE